MEKPKSIFVPEMSYDSGESDEPWQGQINNEDGFPLCIVSADSPKELENAMKAFADSRIAEWEKFKSVLDYVTSVLRGKQKP